jgi:hypothetical protein
MALFPGFKRFHKIAKGDYWFLHDCLSVCRHGKTQLRLDELSLNLVYEYATAHPHLRSLIFNFRRAPLMAMVASEPPTNTSS